MNDDELFRIMCDHFSSLFPRTCPSCGHSYATLKQYILETERLSHPVSYDAELGEWMPDQPMGGMAFANCPCGSTIGLSTEGIPLDQIHAILEWIQERCERSGVTPTELLEVLRDRVRAWALQGGEAERR